jgi:hypothetical protein
MLLLSWGSSGKVLLMIATSSCKRRYNNNKLQVKVRQTDSYILDAVSCVRGLRIPSTALSLLLTLVLCAWHALTT